MPFHVAQNLVRLRRYRGLSQAKVAAAVKTSQSAIARIESAQENITLSTLQRLIGALKGRFRISIAPAEAQMPEWPMQWWDAADMGLTSTNAWTHTVGSVRTLGNVKAVVSSWSAEQTIELTGAENRLQIPSAVAEVS